MDTILDYCDGDHLILGDWDAHNKVWYPTDTSEKGQQRGETLKVCINSSNLITIDDHHPPRLPMHGNPSSRDLSTISAHLAADSSWETRINPNSDHLPITIDINTELSPTPTKEINHEFQTSRLAIFHREDGGVVYSSTLYIQCLNRREDNPKHYQHNSL